MPRTAIRNTPDPAFPAWVCHGSSPTRSPAAKARSTAWPHNAGSTGSPLQTPQKTSGTTPAATPAKDRETRQPPGHRTLPAGASCIASAPAPAAAPQFPPQRMQPEMPAAAALPLPDAAPAGTAPPASRPPVARRPTANQNEVDPLPADSCAETHFPNGVAGLQTGLRSEIACLGVRLATIPKCTGQSLDWPPFRRKWPLFAPV